MFPSRLIQNIITGAALALLVLVLVVGSRSGIGAGKTRTVTATVPAIQAGLNYFYQDQNRYPTTQEFADRNLMLNYFTPFPPEPVTGKNCNRSYVYQGTSLNSYTLHFCLAAASGGLQPGWNQVVNSK